MLAEPTRGWSAFLSVPRRFLRAWSGADAVRTNLTLYKPVPGRQGHLNEMVSVQRKSDHEGNGEFLPSPSRFAIADQSRRRTRSVPVLSQWESQEAVLAQFPVQIPFAHSENLGRVAAMTLGGLDRPSDMREFYFLECRHSGVLSKGTGRRRGFRIP